MMNGLDSETLLKRTTSRCPTCHAPCPAEVWKLSGKPQIVWLRRTCLKHGEAQVCISSDARFYWLAQGDPQNQCCGGNACSASDGAVRGTFGRNAAGREGENVQRSTFNVQRSERPSACACVRLGRRPLEVRR